LGNWACTVIVSDVDENRLPGESPSAYVLRLAHEKASTAAGRCDPGAVVIGADTAVIDGGQVLGKPADPADAGRMLRQLRGRTHQVFTGLAVLGSRDRNLRTELCVTDVPMRDYSEDELEAYIRSGDPMDKAGAYAIQHPGFQPVESMNGCYASVMGLPLCHLVRALRSLGVRPNADVPAACQSFLDYKCPVSGAILRGETAG
jgi:MAF protein